MQWLDQLNTKQQKTLTVKNELTEQQKLFCKEYVKDFNATQAATRAGYSENTAHAQGCRLLKHVKAAEYIEELKEKRMDRLDIDADWVLRELIALYGQCTDNNDRLNARGTMQLIGKHVSVGAFEDKSKINQNVSGDIGITVKYVRPDSTDAE